MAGYKITERSARALARLLNDGGSTNVGAKGYRDSSFSRVRLARAPVGGIPARVTTTLGSVTNCNPIVVDPDTGVITVDTSREFQCYNLSESVVGDTGDRYIMVTNHSNGAFAIAPGGGGSLTECDALFSTLDTVTFATGDQVLVVRDGCLKLIDVDPCA
jgi:hypothetical protein